MTGRRRNTADSQEAGAVLVIVLWLLAALALAAVTFAATMRTEATIGRNTLVNAQARAAADAGIYRGILALFGGPPERRWQVDGRSYDLRFGDAQVTVSLTSESGKIDLNTAPDELLEGLFRAAGLAPAEALRLVDAIRDWRDEDDTPAVNGAELTDYQDRGLPYGPRNGPFASVEELEQVIGMTHRLYQRVAPALTVFSGRRGIDPTYAPRLALLAVPGMDPDDVEAILATRRQNQYAEPAQPLPLPGDLGDWLISSVGPVYTVRAEAKLPGGATFVREATVWLANEGRVPYWILDWKAGAPAPRDGDSEP